MALTKAEMAERLFDEVGLNKREAKEFVDAFFDALLQRLLQARVQLADPAQRAAVAEDLRRTARVRPRGGGRAVSRAGALSRYPSVRRDLAFVVPENVTWARVSASVRAAAGHSLRDLVLFDRYAGKGVETGCKSLAMGLILQDDSRTLTDRDVDAVVAGVVAALQGEHGAVIRG